MELEKDKQLVAVENKDDMSSAEISALELYKRNGCPGLTKVTEDKVFGWFELYMSGKGYAEIANISKDHLDKILYIAEKTKWFQKKMEVINSISQTMTRKYIESKTKSIDTVATIVNALSTYYGDQFNQFIQTKNVNFIENLDTKLLAHYYKSIETLDKLMLPSGDKAGAPITPVNINISGNNSIKQSDDKTLEISQEDSSKSILSLLSELKKMQEKK